MPVFCSKARAVAWFHNFGCQLISVRLFQTFRMTLKVFHEKSGVATTGMERARLQALGQLEGTTSMGPVETNGSWMRNMRGCFSQKIFVECVQSMQESSQAQIFHIFLN